MTLATPNSMIEQHIGLKVFLPGAPGQGILRYLGEIEGKGGVFGGLELIGPMATIKGKNSGAVDGKQYFEVKIPQTGLFIPIERLKTANPQLSRPPSRKSSGGGTAFGDSAVAGRRTSQSSLASPTTAGNFSNGRLSRPGSRLSSQDLFRSKPIVAAPTEERKDGFTLVLALELQLKSLSISKDSLERELDQLKSEHQRNLLEMKEKMSILNDLQGTVELLHPLLENYERELVEKDSKISKQRSEFEKAREEWRESLDVLATTQQEAEQYYEMEIEKLIAKVEELKAVSEKSSEKEVNEVSSEKLDELQRTVDDLTMEKIILEKQLRAEISSQAIEIRKLKESAADEQKLTDLKNKLESLESELEAAHKEASEHSTQLNSKDFAIDSLRREHAEFQQKISTLKTESAAKVDKLVVSALEETIRQLTEKNNSLQTSLNGKAVDSLESMGSLEEEIESNKSTISALNEKLAANQKMLELVSEEGEATKELLTKQNMELEKKLNESEATNKNLESQLAESKQIAESQLKLALDTNRISSNLSEYKTLNVSMENEIKSLNDQISKLTIENTKLNEKSVQMSNLTKESAQLREELDELVKENQILKEKIETGDPIQLEEIRAEHASIQKKLKSENDSLQLEYNQSKEIISQHEQTINENERKWEKLKEDSHHNTLALKLEHEKILEDFQTAHQKELETLKLKHSQLLESTTLTHEKKLQSLKDSHHSELQSQGGDLDSIRSTHDKEIDLLQSTHTSEIDTLSKLHNSKYEALQQQYEEKTIQHQNTHAEKFAAIELEYKSKVESLKAEHNQHLKDLEHENAASSYKLKQTIDSLKVEKTALYDKSQESIKQFEAFKFNSETQFKELENTIKAKDIFINDLQTQLDKQASNLAPKEEISRLQDEVSALKEKLDENSHLDKMISQLKHELEMRPTFEELAELQKSIEEIEILHKSETDERDKELHEVMKLKRELEMELEATKKELNELREEMITSNSRGRIADLTKDSTINSTEASINVGLPIYTPNAPIDPSSGKEKWCGLCERDGHDSLHCPYENDMF